MEGDSLSALCLSLSSCTIDYAESVAASINNHVTSDSAPSLAFRLCFDIERLLTAKDGLSPQGVISFLTVSCSLLAEHLNDLGEHAIDLVLLVSQLVERALRFEKSTVRRHPRRILQRLLSKQPQLFEPLIKPLLSSTTLGSQSCASAVILSAASRVCQSESKQSSSASSSASSSTSASSEQLRGLISKHSPLLSKLWEDGVVGSREKLSTLQQCVSCAAWEVIV